MRKILKHLGFYDNGKTTVTEKQCNINDVIPRYEVEIIHQGNGEWYHPTKDGNPLDHQWHIIDNIARCVVCHQEVRKILINEG